MGDVGRGETGSGHLVEQRLEKMMILAVDDGDTSIWMSEILAKSEPAETRPEDHHMSLFALHALIFGPEALNIKSTKGECINTSAHQGEQPGS